MSVTHSSTTNILWFLPTHGDGRYLGTTAGGREVNFNYLRQIAQAADQHHEEVAKAQAEATGVDIEAIRRFVDRSTYRVVPVNGEVIESQQAVADRFARLGLIPKPINVSDIVWKWTPGS